jgi:gliding motility-associated lipoprotein GldD
MLAVLFALTACGWGCGAPPPVPRPAGYFRIALHDTTFSQYSLDCPLSLEVSNAALVEKVQEFVPDSCWFNLVYPRYKARVHCTYAGGIDLEAVMEDAFKLAYEHEVKADAIEVRQRDYEAGGSALKWRLKGDAASPLQFLCTDGQDRFLRGALYFEVRPNGDSLSPVVDRLDTDLEHLMANLNWR